MIARCFGSAFFFAFLSLSSSCVYIRTCVCVCVCMHVRACACVHLGRLLLNPSPFSSQSLSSFALAPLYIFFLLFCSRPSVKPTALSVSFSLSFLRIHSVSFPLLLTAESPFYHLAAQQLVATTSFSSGRNKGVFYVLRESRQKLA